jgi:hypothetical protein
MRCIHLKGKSKTFFIRLNIPTSNAYAFKEFLRPLFVLPNSTASWRMRVIYTSKGVMKRLRCVLYIRCALSIEKIRYMRSQMCYPSINSTANLLYLYSYFKHR